MDLHSGDNLLGDCMTSIVRFLSILPWDIGVILLTWWMPLIVDTWRDSLAWRMTYLGGGALCILKEGIKAYNAWGVLDSWLEAWSCIEEVRVVIVFLHGKLT